MTTPSLSDPTPERGDAETPDDDWAPQILSIWDQAEDEDPQHSWDRALDDAFGDPFAPPDAEPGVDWHRAQAWLNAEREVGRGLLDAATTVARLDERLRHSAARRQDGLRKRIALSLASDVLWAEGARLRPEHLALADRDRIGRTQDEDQTIARAAWAVRRMTQKTNQPDTLASVRRFLGLHANQAESDSAESTDATGDALWLSGLDPHAASEWCQVQTALSSAHPLTRAAAGFHLWRGFGLSAPERLCEALVLAARIAGDMALGGLIAVPVTLPSTVHAGLGNAADRLQHWCTQTRETARRFQRVLDDLDAWRLRAEIATQSLNGKSPAGLIALFEAHPVLSANDCASALDRTPTQTRQILNTFEDRGLITEITGQKRFRFWKANV